MLNEEYNFDIFIAYHGDDIRGSQKLASEIYKSINGKLIGDKKIIRAFFKPESLPHGNFSETPRIVARTPLFLLVANKNIPINQDGQIAERSSDGSLKYLYQEIHAFRESEYFKKASTGTAAKLLISDDFEYDKASKLDPMFAGTEVFQTSQYNLIEKIIDWIKTVSFDRVKITPPNSIKEDKRDLTSEEKNMIISKIRSIVDRHTLCDEKWTQAITSQNFLVDLASILDMTHDESYDELLDTFLQSFSPQFRGGFKLNERNILIIPDENEKLINCMLEEDKKDSYYIDTGTLSADKITNPDQIYKNYLYGTILNIATVANSSELNSVFYYCISELLNDNSLDKRGGWIHYRLPWITARILLGIHNVLDKEKYFRRLSPDAFDKVTKIDKKSLDSLIARIYDNKYWRSGAGDWVSRWESTGLCLEAFLTSSGWLNNQYYIENINKIIDYLFQESIVKEWLPTSIDFSNEDETNERLAQIVLCSVLYRIIKIDKWKRYSSYCKPIGDLFIMCINKLYDSEKVNARQYCTIQQIILYIAKAIKEETI